MTQHPPTPQKNFIIDVKFQHTEMIIVHKMNEKKKI